MSFAVNTNNSTGFSISLTASTTGQIKVFTGSWVAKPVKVYDGGSWVTKPVKTWNGSSWIVTPY